ncbi:MAG: pitrilysin family protein [Rhodocyclaceae bacterium]|nr:pitrilysin family protein [Rhodocyclaceae bacterium]
MNRPSRRHPAAPAFLGALLGAMLWSCAVAAAAAPPAADIVRARLDNGLRVIIVRNALAPVVSTAVNYLVGADETPPGFPGMAHAQEHMMFRGGPGLSADQLADIGSVMGGNFNADTQQSVTQYLYTVPAEDLDIALHIEASRMRDIADSAADWDQERGAIEQEVAQDLSNPTYVLSTRLRAALFAGTPYARDALGTRPSFDKTTAAMLKTFYRRWYAPNNAILVIVGDLDPAATLNKVRDLFAAIPAKVLPARRGVALQPVRAQSLHIDSDLPFGLQVTALRLPGLDSPDYPACEVLADVLRSERGALHELVPQGKALFTRFAFEALPKAGLAYAAAAFPAGGDAGKVARDVRDVLAAIARDGVPADLVAAAKLQERRAAEAEKNSIAGLAAVWSEAVAVDGLDSPDEDLARIDKVTVADVNRVARRYLDPDRAVRAVLAPQGAGKPVAGRSFGGQESIALGEAKPTPLPDWAQAVLGRLAVPASTLHPVVSTLANGITLIVQPETVGDTVSLYGHIRNRPELEVPAGQEGLPMVLDRLFAYGSEHLDRLAFQRALDAIGADEKAGADFEVSELKEQFAAAVDLLADNELHPALPAAAFETVRAQVAQTVAGRLQSPAYLSERALRAGLFPRDDPTLREALPQTVSALSLDDVRRYHQAAFRPDLTAIVVIGNIDPDEARAIVAKAFGAWTAVGPPPATTLPAVPPNAASQTAIPDASRVQDRAMLAETLGITRSSPDYYALKLGDTVLGGGFYAARLSRDLRKNAGLVYSINSFIDAGISRSVYFVLYAADPQNVPTVSASVARELDTMRRAPVAAEELQRAKAMLLRQIPLAEASTDAIAHGLLDRWELNLPLDEPTRAAQRYIELGADDVEAAFAKWLRPAALVQVTQGPPRP